MLRHTPVWISLLLLLVGCSTVTNRDVFPEGEPTVKEVYDRHFGKQDQHSLENVKRELKASGIRNLVGPGTGAGYGAFTRDALTELHTLFPLVANRELAMYVPGHLATEGRNPVPGYVTSFWLYDGRPYALPGERTRFDK